MLINIGTFLLFSNVACCKMTDLEVHKVCFMKEPIEIKEKEDIKSINLAR
jgi:hypothetical protein